MTTLVQDQAGFPSPFFQETGPDHPVPTDGILAELEAFRDFGTATRTSWLKIPGLSPVPVYINEFWTARQRAAHSLHEISYRACFKPQLPRFFIERLSAPGEVVYDPFMGRGTTLLEAALLGRRPAGCDINPLSRILLAPRLSPPKIETIREALDQVDWNWRVASPPELLAFYHPETLRELCILRGHFLKRGGHPGNAWIRMVATNRLTGHSNGFFSAYTLPPNQSVSVASQRKINARRGQTPPRRIVPGLILKKTESLLADVESPTTRRLSGAGEPVLITGDCRQTPTLPGESVSLVVTSPPFLDVVNYAADNWLRCWFNHIDPRCVDLWMSRRVDEWAARMEQVFRELYRVLRPGGWVAMEVGEVRGGKIRLEEAVIPAAVRVGLTPVLVLIHEQEFTKTSNCWGVDNGKKGTNTNRVILLRKASKSAGEGTRTPIP